MTIWVVLTESTLDGYYSAEDLDSVWSTEAAAFARASEVTREAIGKGLYRIDDKARYVEVALDTIFVDA